MLNPVAHCRRHTADSCDKLRLTIVAIVCATFATDMMGQAAPFPVRSVSPLTPFAVSDAVAQRHPSIRTARAQLLQAEGFVVVSTGGFESTLRLSAVTGRDFTVAAGGSAGTEIASGRITRSGYAVSASRLLHNGVVLAPSISVSRNEFSTLPGVATSAANVSLAAVVPLWKDRGGRVSAAPERAALKALASSEANLTQTIATATADGLSSYWNYVAATARLVVAIDNESRASRIVSDMRALVAGDERTVADLNVVEANFAAKRVSRITAQQSVVESRATLGLAMGLEALQASLLAEPAGSFPDTIALISLRTNAELLALAMQRRDDLRAARFGEASARAQLDGARDDQRPRFDAVFSIGYAGLAQGYGAKHLVSPLIENVPGANASLQFRYDIPTTNQGARGRGTQAEGLALQQRFAREDLERRVESGVFVATAAIRSAAELLMQSDAAIRLSERAIRNEMQKFRLGVTTVFEVIQSQDALTNAQLTRISAQRTYADALLSLRLQTGTLLDESQRGARLMPDALRAFP